MKEKKNSVKIKEETRRRKKTEKQKGYIYILQYFMLQIQKGKVQYLQKWILELDQNPTLISFNKLITEGKEEKEQKASLLWLNKEFKKYKMKIN